MPRVKPTAAQTDSIKILKNGSSAEQIEKQIEALIKQADQESEKSSSAFEALVRSLMYLHTDKEYQQKFPGLLVRILFNSAYDRVVEHAIIEIVQRTLKLEQFDAFSQLFIQMANLSHQNMYSPDLLQKRFSFIFEGLLASLEKEPDKIEQLLVKTGAMALAKLLLVYNHDRLYAMLSFLLTNPTAVLFPTFREAFRLLNLTKNDPFCEYRKTVIVGLIIKNNARFALEDDLIKSMANSINYSLLINITDPSLRQKAFSVFYIIKDFYETLAFHTEINYARFPLFQKKDETHEIVKKLPTINHQLLFANTDPSSVKFDLSQAELIGKLAALQGLIYQFSRAETVFKKFDFAQLIQQTCENLIMSGCDNNETVKVQKILQGVSRFIELAKRTMPDSFNKRMNFTKEVKSAPQLRMTNDEVHSRVKSGELLIMETGRCAKELLTQFILTYLEKFARYGQAMRENDLDATIVYQIKQFYERFLMTEEKGGNLYTSSEKMEEYKAAYNPLESDPEDNLLMANLSLANNPVLNFLRMFYQDGVINYHSAFVENLIDSMVCISIVNFEHVEACLLSLADKPLNQKLDIMKAVFLGAPPYAIGSYKRVKYLSESEQFDKQIFIDNNGTFVKFENEVDPTTARVSLVTKIVSTMQEVGGRAVYVSHHKPKWASFVWTHDKRLLIDTVQKQPYAIHYHSSLARGQALRCSGEMQIVDGKIKGITIYSGHYLPGYLHLREMVNYLLKSGADLSECKFYISNAKLIFNHIDPPTDEPIPGDFNERLESCHVLNLNQLQALPNNPFQFLELECVRLCDVLVSISWDEYFEHPSETDVASINQLVSSINKLIANSNQNIGYTVDTLQRLIMLTRGKISTNHGIEVTPMQQKLESFFKELLKDIQLFDFVATFPDFAPAYSILENMEPLRMVPTHS